MMILLKLTTSNVYDDDDDDDFYQINAMLMIETNNKSMWPNTPKPNLKTPADDDFVQPAIVPMMINELNILPILFQLMHHSSGNFKIEFLFSDKLSKFWHSHFVF